MTGWNGRRLSEEGKVTNRGLELPHLFLNSGEEVLPVFSSVEVASRFLSSVVFG
jgi:hypothetical protein